MAAQSASRREVARSLLEVRRLTVRFQARRGIFNRKVGQVMAVEDVSFAIGRGQVVALVGESGSGKTTIGRAILRLIEPTSGSVLYDGEDLMAIPPGRLRAMRRKMQIIFQDPFASLNPRMTVEDIIAEGLRIHEIAVGQTRLASVTALLEQVGLSGAFGHRFPHELSGGQRQRIGIARALAVDPEFIVADEPVSALDVSIQAQIINLLQDLRERLSLTLLFIGHDLRVVEYLADTVLVMYLGRLMEVAPVDELYSTPRHP